MVSKNTKIYHTLNFFLMFLTFCLLAHALYMYTDKCSASSLPSYRDELVYIECGLKYIKGVPPYFCNLEHPPFAKYLIGLSVLYGFSRQLLSFIYATSCIMVYLICTRLGFKKTAIFCSLFLLFDTLFFNTFRFLLLDPFAVFFTLLGVYFLFTYKVVASGLAMGMAVASKFSALPATIGCTILVYRNMGLRSAIKFTAIVFLVYLSTYIMDFTLGYNGVLKHHIEMYTYMFWRHGFSLPIALNGVLKLLTKAELWVYRGEFTIVVDVKDSIMHVVEEVFREDYSRIFFVGVGLGSPLWYALFPALIYNTYKVLVGRGNDKLESTVILSWFSLVNIVPGPLDWYYSNLLPFLYMNPLFIIEKITPINLQLRILLPILVLQILAFMLTIHGIIPFVVKYVTK